MPGPPPAFNDKLRRLWPELRSELQRFVMPPADLQAALRKAGGPTTATEMGLPRKVWRDAIEIRPRRAQSLVIPRPRRRCGLAR